MASGFSFFIIYDVIYYTNSVFTGTCKHNFGEWVEFMGVASGRG